MATQQGSQPEIHETLCLKEEKEIITSYFSLLKPFWIQENQTKSVKGKPILALVCVYDFSVGRVSFIAKKKEHFLPLLIWETEHM